MCLNNKTENYIKNALKKGDFLERLNFGPISTPCILGTVGGGGGGGGGWHFKI
jgi:hypothetical protein